MGLQHVLCSLECLEGQHIYDKQAPKAQMWDPPPI